MAHGRCRFFSVIERMNESSRVDVKHRLISYRMRCYRYSADKHEHEWIQLWDNNRPLDPMVERLDAVSKAIDRSSFLVICLAIWHVVAHWYSDELIVTWTKQHMIEFDFDLMTLLEESSVPSGEYRIPLSASTRKKCDRSSFCCQQASLSGTEERRVLNRRNFSKWCSRFCRWPWQMAGSLMFI